MHRTSPGVRMARTFRWHMGSCTSWWRSWTGIQIEIGWGGRPATHQSEYYMLDTYGHDADGFQLLKLTVAEPGVTTSPCSFLMNNSSFTSPSSTEIPVILPPEYNVSPR